MEEGVLGLVEGESSVEAEWDKRDIRNEKEGGLGMDGPKKVGRRMGVGKKGELEREVGPEAARRLRRPHAGLVAVGQKEDKTPSEAGYSFLKISSIQPWRVR